MWDSLREILLVALLQMAIALLFLVGLRGDVKDFIREHIPGVSDMPRKLWVVLFVVAMMVGPFLAFHNLRVERDGAFIDATTPQFGYRRLLPQRRDQLVIGFDKLMQNHGEIEFVISCKNNRDILGLCDELASILSESGFPVQIEKYDLSTVKPALTVSFGGNATRFTRDVINVLDELSRSQIFVNTLEGQDGVVITVDSVPKFFLDGTVFFDW